jgi:hypothetical protein
MMASGRNQTQKITYCMTPLIWAAQNSKFKETESRLVIGNLGRDLRVGGNWVSPMGMWVFFFFLEGGSGNVLGLNSDDGCTTLKILKKQIILYFKV